MNDMKQIPSIFPELKVRDGVSLLQHTMQYADAYYDIMSSGDLMRYYGRTLLDRKDAVAREFAAFDDYFRRGESVYWAIVDTNTNSYMGLMSMHKIEPHHSKATLGIVISRNYWGKGIAYDVTSRVCQYAFEELEMNRLQTYVDERNRRAIDNLKHIGFTVEGTLRESEYENGEYINIVVFSMLSKDLA